MTKQEAKKRIEKLKKLINHHRYLYHVLDRQEISDSAFDSLKHELYKLEQRFPEFITPDSPTQRVEGKALEGFKKVRHSVPMLSIEDIFSEKELQSWEDYLKRLDPEAKFEYFTELKIDGLAVSLVYQKGIFTRGATRGDGKTGEDVTQNLRTIESIPLKLEIHGKLPSLVIEKKIRLLIQSGEIEVRGEIYMEKRKFEKLNKELQKRGERIYANPRNLAAGSIRQLDPKLAAIRPLDFLAYDIVTDIGQKNHFAEHQILPALGFKTDKGKESKTLSEVIDFWKKISKKRESFPFQIDGVVVSINNNLLFEELGLVGKSPRAIRAFKFSPKQATTKILDIKIQIGRTGAATPVAILEPVEVGGVTISRTTLHNEDEIKRLGIKIGDTVIVGRAGDVIPHIVKVLSELRTGKEKKFRFSKRCPVCEKELIKPAGEVIWRCFNPACSARQRKYFYHFISKGAFDIEGLGPRIIDKLIDAGLVSDPADIFKLKSGDILPLENLSGRKPKTPLRGFAEKSTQNLIGAIQSKKKISLSRFIYALGIRNVGVETVQDLVQYFGSLEKLKRAALSDLEKIRDVGPIVAKSIYNFFQKKKNLEFIEKLERSGIKIISDKRPKYQPFGEKIFVLTGKLETMTRKEAEEKIRLRGGEISESVSKKTSYLIAGEKPSSKLDRAKELGISIIREIEFKRLLK